MTASVSNGSTCPICNEGKLIFAAIFITCCVCQKIWLEYEFIADWRDAVEHAEAVSALYGGKLNALAGPPQR